jgi:hypothetical protein
LRAEGKRTVSRGDSDRAALTKVKSAVPSGEIFIVDNIE